jgi:hypothetical protein
MSAAALAKKHNIGYGRALALQRRAGEMQDAQVLQGRQVSSFNPDGDIVEPVGTLQSARSEPPETKNLEPDTSSDHYACVIADLVAKRDLLQHAIETLEALRP